MVVPSRQFAQFDPLQRAPVARHFGEASRTTAPKGNVSPVVPGNKISRQHFPCPSISARRNEQAVGHKKKVRTVIAPSQSGRGADVHLVNDDRAVFPMMRMREIGIHRECPEECHDVISRLIVSIALGIEHEAVASAL